MITNEQAPGLVFNEILNAAAESLLSEGGSGSTFGLSGNILISDTKDPLPYILKDVEPLIGAPDLYAGGSAGILARWDRGTRSLTLKVDEAGIRLSLQDVATLDAAETPMRRSGVGRTPGWVPSHRDLPYLWQIYQGPERTTPSVPPTRDWKQLEASLGALLLVWAEQIPLLFGTEGSEEVACNLINQADDEQIMVILQSRDDGLLLLLDDRRSPATQTDAQTMFGRGWHEMIPVLGAWKAAFEPSPDSAAEAAKLAVNELRLRGAASPLDIAVTDLSKTKHGRLLLPGLPLPQVQASRSCRSGNRQRDMKIH